MSVGAPSGGPAVDRREFSMAQLVERTGVPAATVRYYLSEGLLPAPTRKAANRFLYDDRHVEVIRLVRLLQERRGLSLEVIGRMLPELLPDLVGQPLGGVFRPEMWGLVLAAHTRAGPSLRERVLAAGLDAFARHGYGDVSVDDVCRAASVAKGSFYRYFSSKEELFLAAVQRAGADVAASLGALQGEGEDLALQLSGLLEPYLVVLLDLVSLAAQRRPGHAEALRAVAAEVVSGLAAAGQPAGWAEELLGSALLEAVRARTAEQGAQHQ